MRFLFFIASPPVLMLYSIAEGATMLALSVQAQQPSVANWSDLVLPLLLGLAGPVLVFLATQRKTGLDSWLGYQKQLSEEVGKLQKRLDDVEDEVLTWREWAFDLDGHVSKLELTMREKGLEPPARPVRRRVKRGDE